MGLFNKKQEQEKDWKQKEREVEEQKFEVLNRLNDFTKDLFGKGSSVSLIKVDGKEKYYITLPADYNDLKNIIEKLSKQVEILKNFQFSNLKVEKKFLDLMKQFNEAQVEISSLRNKIKEFDIEKNIQNQVIDKVSLAVGQCELDKKIDKKIHESYKENVKGVFNKDVNKKIDELDKDVKAHKQNFKKEYNRKIVEFNKNLKVKRKYLNKQIDELIIGIRKQAKQSLKERQEKKQEKEAHEPKEI